MIKNIINLNKIFGIRSIQGLYTDLKFIFHHMLTGKGFQFGPESIQFLRPDLSIPAYLGKYPEDHLARIYHLFDRDRGGVYYSQRVTRRNCFDFRKKKLSYDEHDGVDFVCPIDTPIHAAAPGKIILIRDRWFRGGLTVTIDHGFNLFTQYSHLLKTTSSIGKEVKRDDIIGFSGCSGVDIFGFFPWVPPHLHFSVMYQGKFVDPFIAPEDTDRPGQWLERNNPKPSSPLDSDQYPTPSSFNQDLLEQLILLCRDERIKLEIKACERNFHSVAALLEDAIHHDSWAFPKEIRNVCLRFKNKPQELNGISNLKLTLPLPGDKFQGILFADSGFTQKEI
jgi:hypothetical protein